MAKYAITTVFYLECDDEEQVEHTIYNLIEHQNFYPHKGEGYQVVEITELERF
jgi:hypothetical protein